MARNPAIPIPAGGFSSNEEEADWLSATLAMRFEEAVETTLGVVVKMKMNGLRELLLLSLDSATRRESKKVRASPPTQGAQQC